MSTLTIITGTLEDARDPFGRLDLNELYYEFLEEDPEDPENVIVSRDRAPIISKGFDKFDVVQTMGCGKTLKAMDILANKAIYNGVVLANLGLIWNNEGRDEKQWVAGVNSFDDLWELNNCTVLFDDFSILVPSWNTEEANTISPIVNNSGKAGLDIIITAQQEVQVPPKIRRVATDWIVPIIRVRDRRRITPRNDGYPLEMVCMHFDGTKVLKYISDPMIGLEPLFKAYRTVERAGSLKGGESPRTNQSGYEFEEKWEKWLLENVPEQEWIHLPGKDTFDFIPPKPCIYPFAFDTKELDNNGYIDLRKHDKTLKNHLYAMSSKGWKSSYIVTEYANDWALIPITPKLNAKIRKGGYIIPEDYVSSIQRPRSVFVRESVDISVEEPILCIS